MTEVDRLGTSVDTIAMMPVRAGMAAPMGFAASKLVAGKAAWCLRCDAYCWYAVTMTGDQAHMPGAPSCRHHIKAWQF
jgi:hypothetical protein